MLVLAHTAQANSLDDDCEIYNLALDTILAENSLLGHHNLAVCDSIVDIQDWWLPLNEESALESLEPKKSEYSECLKNLLFPFHQDATCILFFSPISDSVVLAELFTNIKWYYKHVKDPKNYSEMTEMWQSKLYRIETDNHKVIAIKRTIVHYM